MCSALQLYLGIATALQAINSAACSPPLVADEVDRIADSVCKYDTGSDEAFGWLGDVVESEPQFLAYADQSLEQLRFSSGQIICADVDLEHLNLLER